MWVGGTRRKIVGALLALTAATLVAVGTQPLERSPQVLGRMTDNPVAAYYAEFAPTTESVGWTGSRTTCEPGTIRADYREDVLDRVNYFREISGVDPVTTSADLDASAQAAAIIQSHLDKPTHLPSLGSRCFSSAGATGSAQSLLHLNSGLGAVDELIHDYGDINDDVGHRAWLLAPELRQIGIGEIPGPAETDAMAI
jgi:uncharacterized protein YkwD